MTGNSKFNEIVKYIAATTVFSVLLFFYSDYAAHKNRFDPENLSAANNTVFYTEVSAYQNSVPVPENSAYACALIDANSGSLIFSVCTGIEVFITYMYGFKKNTFNAVLTVIIALILITDLILLIIFKQNALIEGLPIIFALAVMPVTQAVFTLSSKSKETANAS